MVNQPGSERGTGGKRIKVLIASGAAATAIALGGGALGLVSAPSEAPAQARSATVTGISAENAGEQYAAAGSKRKRVKIKKLKRKCQAGGRVRITAVLKGRGKIRYVWVFNGYPDGIQTAKVKRKKKVRQYVYLTRKASFKIVKPTGKGKFKVLKSKTIKVKC